MYLIYDCILLFFSPDTNSANGLKN